MTTARIVIGVDSSTQSTKALAVDAGTGVVLGVGRAEHSVSAGSGRESDPEQWWRALLRAVAATGYAERAEAVSVAAQQLRRPHAPSAHRPPDLVKARDGPELSHPSRSQYARLPAKARVVWSSRPISSQACATASDLRCNSSSTVIAML